MDGQMDDGCALHGCGGRTHNCMDVHVMVDPQLLRVSDGRPMVMWTCMQWQVIVLEQAQWEVSGQITSECSSSSKVCLMRMKIE